MVDATRVLIAPTAGLATVGVVSRFAETGDPPGTHETDPETHPANAVTAVIDVGGTSIKTGVVVDGEAIVGRSFPALASAPAPRVLGRLAEATQCALDDAARHGARGATTLAVAFPGPFDLDSGTALIRGLRKFDSIYGIALRPELRSRTTVGDRPIVFVGDNEAAGVGEAVFGAGVGYERVLTITLGTGVGACLTANGTPVPTVGDLTIERLALRHTPWGRADDVMSASGLAARLAVDTAELPRAVQSSAATAPLRDHGRRLGRFLAPVVVEVRADAVVIGGGLAASFDRLRPTLHGELVTTPCLRATLGAAGPMLGAARLSEYR